MTPVFKAFRSRLTLLVGLCLVVLLAASCTKQEPFDESAWLSRGAETITPVKQNLIASLSAGLAESPQQAVSACRLEAPAIAARFSTDSVTIGRTSHLLRNPANVAPNWARPLLEEYVNNPSVMSPRAVQVGQSEVGYVEPVLMAPLCVSCHGATIDSTLQSTIRELYPNDEAVGFGEGDFRGVFWIKFASPHAS